MFHYLPILIFALKDCLAGLQPNNHEWKAKTCLRTWEWMPTSVKAPCRVPEAVADAPPLGPTKPTAGSDTVPGP